MAAMGRDLKLSTQRVIGYRNFGTKLWNAARFAEFNMCKPVDSFDPKMVNQTLNKWIIGEVAKSREAMDDALNQYRFNDTANVLYTFVWGKVCDWYVEFSKPLFQGDDLNIKQETRNTLAWVIDQCLIMLHPIMPFITEQLWSDIADRSNMLIHEDWPTYKSIDLMDITADNEMNWVISIIENIRSVRSEMNVNAGAKIDLIILELDESKKATFNENLLIIKRLARLEGISHSLVAPKCSVTLAVDGGTICLPLSQVIDLSVEKNRLQKLLDKLTTDIGITEKRIGNAKFVKSAPANVLAENKQRLVQWNSESEKLITAIHRLNEMS